MTQIALKLFTIIEILFFIGFLFILYIIRHKGLEGPLRRGMWVKYGLYFLIVNTFLLATFMGQPYFYSLLLIIVFLGLREFFQMLVGKGISAYKNVGITVGMGIFLSAILRDTAVFYPAMLLGLVSILLIPIFKGGEESAISNISSTVLGIFYISFLLAHLVLVYKLSHGFYYVAFLFAVLTMNDGFSELFGRSLGKRSMWSQISPNKTYAGSIGGLLSAMAGSLLFSFLLLDMPIYYAVVSGVLVGISGQLGDLIASVFKRDASIKDFGIILPGHGGILDRFDSLIFAAPVFYYFIILTY
ncbi:MAG TPA: phosphatidate cytidylyltransferase [Anaerolineae bacterium]|jgi:phosphatidate cytidylyltransferase|nr:phosphatidate cytidylyltransferase [Anaerolineae bacterium]